MASFGTWSYAVLGKSPLPRAPALSDSQLWLPGSSVLGPWGRGLALLPSVYPPPSLDELLTSGLHSAAQEQVEASVTTDCSSAM